MIVPLLLVCFHKVPGGFRVQRAPLTVSGWTRHSSVICDDRPGAFQRSGSLSPGVTRHLNKPS